MRAKLRILQSSVRCTGDMIARTAEMTTTPVCRADGPATNTMPEAPTSIGMADQAEHRRVRNQRLETVIRDNLSIIHVSWTSWMEPYGENVVVCVGSSADSTTATTLPARIRPELHLSPRAEAWPGRVGPSRELSHHAIPVGPTE